MDFDAWSGAEFSTPTTFLPGNGLAALNLGPQRIERAFHPVPAPVENMGVDHGSRHIRMAEEFLHGTDVVAAFNQVGSEACVEVSSSGLSAAAVSATILRRGSPFHHEASQMTIPAYAKTLVLVAIMLFLSVPKDGGTWFVLAFFPFVAWALYNLVRVVLKPAERRLRLTRLAIWLAAMVLAGATQVHWSNASREEAGAVAAALIAHKSRTGGYPETLAEAGLNEQSLREEWGIGYRLRDGKPELDYPAAIMPLTTYEYDFATRQWKTNAY